MPNALYASIQVTSVGETYFLIYIAYCLLEFGKTCRSHMDNEHLEMESNDRLLEGIFRLPSDVFYVEALMERMSKLCNRAIILTFNSKMLLKTMMISENLL